MGKSNALLNQSNRKIFFLSVVFGLITIMASVNFSTHPTTSHVSGITKEMKTKTDFLKAQQNTKPATPGWGIIADVNW